jgi:hypothetical protein
MTKKTIYGIITTMSMSLFLIIACSNTANKTTASDGINLEWKVKKNDRLTYKTVMTEIGESTFEMDFGGLFGGLNDSTKTNQNDFFKKFKNVFNNTNLITFLSNSPDFENVIDIEMVIEDKEKNEEDNEESEKEKMMSSMMKGTMLRGSVYSNGSLHSFWVKSNQKNLLSLFFELPNKELNKGDTWTLSNVNFIGNDHNFICKKAEKKNVITLTDIKKSNGETIAVIDYDILEYVLGDFNTPAFFGNEAGSKKTEMKFIYKAQAEFSIEKGKWVSYNGIMSLDASGALNSVQKKKFALIEQ